MSDPKNIQQYVSKSVIVYLKNQENKNKELKAFLGLQLENYQISSICNWCGFPFKNERIYRCTQWINMLVNVCRSCLLRIKPIFKVDLYYSASKGKSKGKLFYSAKDQKYYE